MKEKNGAGRLQKKPEHCVLLYYFTITGSQHPAKRRQERIRLEKGLFKRCSRTKLPLDDVSASRTVFSITNVPALPLARRSPQTDADAVKGATNPREPIPQGQPPSPIQLLT